MNFFLINNKGQSILEVILAVAIFALIGATLSSMILGSFNSLTRSVDMTRAQALLDEAVEAVKSIKGEAWNNFIYNKSSVATNSSEWIFSGEGTTQVIDGYTRTIDFEDVCRDSSDNIVACPGAYTDIHTKKVVVTIEWEVRPGINNSIKRDIYLSNWDSNNWVQTNWSGGGGQDTWLDNSKYSSDDGNINASTTGQISLLKGDILDGGFDLGGNSSNNWPFATSSNYFFDTNKIQILDDMAQLKSGTGGALNSTVDDGFEFSTNTDYDWGFNVSSDYTYNTDDIDVVGGMAELLQSNGGSCSGVATPCNSLSLEGNCDDQGGCSWGGVVSGNTVNANFDSSASSWTYNDWNQGNREVNVTGTYQSSGGNTGGFVDINFPRGKKDELGGYWEQSFTTTVDNPIANIDFDWLVSQFPDSPKTFQLYVFIDSNPGDPTVGQEIWSSGEISSTQGWSNVNNIDVSSYIVTAGTYYLKIATWLETPNKNRGPFTIGYDNVYLDWSGGGSCGGIAITCDTYGDFSSCDGQDGCSWTGGSYPADNPAIYSVNSYSALGIQSWDSFTETAIKNGGEIYYQLSSDDGSTWQYWDGSTWSLAGLNDYNTANVINANISNFDTSSEQIKFKAFLESDGSQLVQLDNINIGLTPSSPVWNFSDWGVGRNEVTPIGVRQSSGGNPNNYIEITVPEARNDEVGGYWEQEFIITEDNPIAELSFDYKSVDFNTSPNIVDVRIYIDDFSGDPSNQVGSSIPLSGEGSWISTSSIDVSSFLTTAGTYYLKMAYWVETSKTDGPFTVGFDNVDLSWQNASYPIDNPNIYPNSSFSAFGVQSWDNFTETATKNSGEIYYQLSSDDGSTWKYWDGSNWSSAGASDYNIASIINTNIPSFDVGSGQIKFKAFLESDGSQLVQLDNINIAYSSIAAVWNFFTWDVDNKEVSPVGTKQNVGGNGDGYIDITIPRGKSDQVGAYWEQPFRVYEDNPVNMSLDFDYGVFDYNGNPNVSELRIYVDSSSGPPINQVGSSINISSNSSWISATPIDPSLSISTAGTYYLKLAYWVETPNKNRGPYTIGFDNINLDLGSGECPKSGYLVSSDYNTGTSSVFQIIEWDEVLPVNSDIQFQIKTSPTQIGLDSAEWAGVEGVDGDETDYFDYSLGQLISLDHNNDRWIRYKALLTGDGYDTPILEEVRINYK